MNKSVKTPAVLLTLLSLLAACITTAGAQNAPGTSAESCILAEAESGAVLYEKNADSRMLIASTTKMLTALVVLELCDPRERVMIAEDFAAVEGSSMYIKPGEILTVSDLLYGMMLASGNDAAAALALYVSGSVEAFSAVMNEYAQSIGCRDSNFVNPHGLDADNHYSTARDLMIIACAAMRNDTLREIVSTKHTTAAGRSLRNHNKLLWNCPGAVGIKTGFTESAGRSLVSCAEREDMRLVCVTLNAPDDWNDHTSLYDWAFSSYRIVRVTKSGDAFFRLPVISGEKEEVMTRAFEEYTAVFPKSDDVDVIMEAPNFVYAPAEEGKQAGVIKVIKNGRTEKTIKLVYGESVALDKSVPLTSWEKLRQFLNLDKRTVMTYGG